VAVVSKIRGHSLADFRPFIPKIRPPRLGVNHWWPVAASAWICALSSVLQADYDWDLDHEIYFASRLLSGELTWGMEYHDKLPLLQFLFFPSALLRSIIPWIIFSFLMCLLLVWSAERLTSTRDGIPSRILQRKETVAFGCFLFWSATVIPGGLAHIDLVAGCLGLAGLFLLSQSGTSGRESSLTFAASVSCCAVSVSIRPNFLFAVGLVWIVRLSARRFLNPRRSRGINLFVLDRLILFPAVSSLLFLILNFLPLASQGKFYSIVNGLTVLASRRNPESALSVFITDPFSFPKLFVLFVLLLSIFTVLEQIRTHRVRSQIELTCALYSLGLAFSFVGRHWWEHYSGLFAASGSLLIAVRVIRALRLLRLTCGKFGRLPFLRPWITLFSASFLLTTSLFLFSNLGQGVTDRDATVREVRAVLGSDQELNAKWLAPYDMRSHWELRQSRHEFPHAAHFLHIERGWWETAPESSSFAIYRNSSELCQGLVRSDLDIIFVKSSSRVHQCLAEAANRSSNFELDEAYYGTTLSVWRSKSRIGS